MEEGLDASFICKKSGAGDGNRTHAASLEGWNSTIELHPHFLTLDYSNKVYIICQPISRVSPYFLSKFFDTLPLSLLSAMVEKHHKRTLENNFQIKPNTLPLDIIDVVFDPFVKLDRVTVFLNLPKAK